MAPPKHNSSPGRTVAGALGRALGGAALSPLRVAGQALRRRRLEAEVRADLDTRRDPQPAPELDLDWIASNGSPDVFISCAEASGEIHARGLVARVNQELERHGAPPARFSGLGSERLRDDGVETLGNPLARAAMGLGAAKQLPFYTRMLRDVAQHFDERPPAVAIGVDSSALHVPLLRIARDRGIPTVHFVTPQYWGWAPWRVRNYARAVDLGLSILPFEPAWFARHGVRVEHVGHPLLDALETIPSTTPDPTSKRLAILPGSRRSVILRNLPWMLARAAKLCRSHPDLEIVLPHDRTELEPLLREQLAAFSGAEPLRARLELGDLHATLATCRAALSVSGTVLLDLLHHRLPTVVVYRLGGPFESFLGRHLLTVPYFASINLLAGQEAVPEFCFHGEGPLAEVDSALSGVWSEGEPRRRCQAALEIAAAGLGPPGATRRAALWALAEARKGHRAKNQQIA